MPNMKTIANVGEKAVRAGAKVLPKLVPLGRALAVISGTMMALTAAGWCITRANEKKRQEKDHK